MSGLPGRPMSGLLAIGLETRWKDPAFAMRLPAIAPPLLKLAPRRPPPPATPPAPHRPPPAKAACARAAATASTGVCSVDHDRSRNHGCDSSNANVLESKHRNLLLS